MFKVLSLVLTFSLLCSNGFAASSVKSAVQELNYALNVEWDQKDMTFYTQQMNSFRDQLAAMNLAAHSKTSIIHEALSALPASAFKSSVETTLKQKNIEQMTDAELHDLLVQISKNSGKKGASWNGSAEVVMPVLIAVGLLVLVVLAISAAQNSDAAPTDGGQTYYQCGLNNTCMGSYGPGFDDSGRIIHGYQFGGGCYQQVCGYFYL